MPGYRSPLEPAFFENRESAASSDYRFNLFRTFSSKGNPETEQAHHGKKERPSEFSRFSARFSTVGYLNRNNDQLPIPTPKADDDDDKKLPFEWIWIGTAIFFILVAGAVVTLVTWWSDGRNWGSSRVIRADMSSPTPAPVAVVPTTEEPSLPPSLLPTFSLPTGQPLAPPSAAPTISVAPSIPQMPSDAPTGTPTPIPARLYILAGGENVQGYASIEHLESLVVEGNASGEWNGLLEATTTLEPVLIADAFCSFDRSYGDFFTTRREGELSVSTCGIDAEHFGPEIGFGTSLRAAYPNEPVIILKATSTSGTLAVDWLPPSRSSNGRGGEYYRQLLDDISDTQKRAAEIAGGAPSNLQAEIEGVLWFHGYADAADPAFVAAYEQNLQALVDDLREVLGKPDLPFLVGQLGAQGSNPVGPELELREIQARVAMANKKVALSTTSQYVVGFDDNDPTSVFDIMDRYYGRADIMVRIGRQFATDMLALESGSAAVVALPDEPIIVDNNFDIDAQGFSFVPDAFSGTKQPDYVNGVHRLEFFVSNPGYLRIVLGGNDALVVNGGLSGAFELAFALPLVSRVHLSFRMRVSQTGRYSPGSTISQGLGSLDGVPIGLAPSLVLTQWIATGDPLDSEWKNFSLDLGELGVGTHVLRLGGYVSEKAASPTVSTEILIDDVMLTHLNPVPDDLRIPAQEVVSMLDFSIFQETTRILSDFGNRADGSFGYQISEAWAINELETFGYTVEQHTYTNSAGDDRVNLYATKIGTTYPDRMFLVSAHLDGTGGAGVDDNAAGCAVLLEMARVFAGADVTTETSIRFVLWSNGSNGQLGSLAYLADRQALQGSIDASGRYPEPTWLGLVQVDTILFDHGLPPTTTQANGADLDIDYDATNSLLSTQSLALANALVEGSVDFAMTYPTKLGPGIMDEGTDSVSFRDVIPAISIRENSFQDLLQGSNPHWQQASDVLSTFSEQDFLLGFDAARTMVGSLAELVALRLPVPQV